MRATYALSGTSGTNVKSQFTPDNKFWDQSAIKLRGSTVNMCIFYQLIYYIMHFKYFIIV